MVSKRCIHSAVVIYCENLNKDLNNYENKIVCIQKHNFYVLNVIYVIFSTKPYKINEFWSKFNLISSIMGI